MDAVKSETVTPEPSKPTAVYVNPADVVELEELSAEDRAAVESASENPKLSSAAKDVLTLTLGGAVGFVIGGYLGNQIQQQAPSGQAVTYAAGVFVLDLVIAGLVIAYGRKHAGRAMLFNAVGTGFALAGLGNLIYQYTSAPGYSGQPIVLPSVTLGPAGSGIIPANRAVAA